MATEAQIQATKPKAVIVQAFGSGNIPNLDPKFVEVFRKARQQGILISVVSQCNRGPVELGIYETSAELSKLISTLIDRAEEAGSAAMPAYTHLQRAEPVLVAHWLLAYAEMLLRDLQRLGDCRKRLNVCPLGSGAVAGTTLPLDRELMSS